MIIHLSGTIESREVFLDGKILKPQRSQKIRNHSPDGFNWGYGGSGPAQLALAVLLECTDEETARNNYQDFKFAEIAELPQGSNFDVNIDITKYVREEES